MSDKLELRVNGAVAYEGEDGRYVLTRDGAVVFDRTLPAVVVPPLPAIDYSNPRLNMPGMNDREQMVFIRTWVYPNGLPVNWSWEEWARVTGREVPETPKPSGVAPDKGGTDLNLPGRRENVFVGGQLKVFTFDVFEPRKVELVIASLAGDYFTKITEQLHGPGQDAPAASHFPFDSHFKREEFLMAGRYIWTVTLNVSGLAGVQKV